MLFGSVKMTSREFQRLQSTTEETTALYVGAYMFELFLYGLYTSLFSFCVYTIWVNRRPTRWPFITAAVLMFGIATADIAVTLYYLFRYILYGNTAPNPYPRNLFFITNNIIADLILIYRCYISWAQKRPVIIVLCVFLVSSTVCGYLSANSHSTRLPKLLSVHIWTTFALNMCLSLLIGGKIFWSAMRARSILGPEAIRLYYSIGAIFIESGVVYSAYLLVSLLVKSVILDAGRNQIVGIVPTLIIARISLGRSQPMQDAGSSSTPVLDSIFSTIGTVAHFGPHTPRVENDTHAQLPHPDEEHTEPV